MKIIPEDEEVVSKDYDSLEIRKMKHKIEEQKKTQKNLIKDLQLNTEKRLHFQKQLAMMDRRIAGVNEILKKRMTDLSDN